MTLDTGQQRTLLRRPAPAALRRAGVSLHLWALDDNFDRWPEADALLSDPAIRAGGVRGGLPLLPRGRVGAARAAGPAPRASRSPSASAAAAVVGRLRPRPALRGAHNAGRARIRNGAAWLVKWNLALDPTGGPTNGGCPTAAAWSPWTRPPDGQPQPDVLRVGARGAVRQPGSPGDRRHGAGPARAWTRWRSGTRTAPTSLVVFNDGGSRDVRVDTGGAGRFGYRLPAGALATFTW